MMRLVTEIRRFRSDQGLRPSQRVAARLVGIEATPLAGHEERIRSLLRLDPRCGRLHRVGVDRGRGHHGRTRRGRRHRRRGRAPPDGEGPRGGPGRGRAGGAEAGQRRLHRQGARRGGGQDPPAPRGGPGRHRPPGAAPRAASPGGRPPGAPRSSGGLPSRPHTPWTLPGPASRLVRWTSKRGCARSSGRSSPVGPSIPWTSPWTGWPNSSGCSAIRSGRAPSFTSPAPTARPRPPG